MALDINGYNNATFQSFVGFAKVMVDGLGNANSIARVTTGVNPGTTIKAGFALRIRPEELERMAKLDYSKFDDTKAQEIVDSNELPDKFRHAVESFDQTFCLSQESTAVYMKFSANFT